MVYIKALISTNASDDEKRRLEISRDAIDEFLGYGYCDDLYQGDVSFRCMPRAINPDLIQFIIMVKDIGESVIAWGAIIGFLIKFIKRCKGYKPTLTIRHIDNEKEIIIQLPLDNEYDLDIIVEQIEESLK